MHLRTPLLVGAVALVATAVPALATTQPPAATAVRALAPSHPQAGVPVAALASTHPNTVHAGLIRRQAGTLAPGSPVTASELIGARVYVDGLHGFALASLRQAQYAAATTDGGHSWHTVSPALHIDAAQGPLAVDAIGAVNRRTVYAYGSGNVVDVTTDAGRQWRRALWSSGTPMAVVENDQNHLVAFIDSFGADSRHGVTWQYVSSGGGRVWHYTTVIGGG